MGALVKPGIREFPSYVNRRIDFDRTPEPTQIASC